MLAGIVPDPEAAFISRETKPVTVLLSSTGPHTQLMAPEVVAQMPIKGKRKVPWQQIRKLPLQDFLSGPSFRQTQNSPVRPFLLGTAFSPESQSGFDTGCNRNWTASRCFPRSFPFHYSLAKTKEEPSITCHAAWKRVSQTCPVWETRFLEVRSIYRSDSDSFSGEYLSTLKTKCGKSRKFTASVTVSVNKTALHHTVTTSPCDNHQKAPLLWDLLPSLDCWEAPPMLIEANTPAWLSFD